MPTPFARRPLLALCSCAVLVSAPDSWALAAPPILQSIQPAQAYPGSIVQLHGSGFGPALGPAAVTLNGVPWPGADTFWSDSLVVFECPSLPDPAALVQVVTQEGVASNSQPMMLQHPTQIYFLSPESDAVLSGGLVHFAVAPQFDHGHVIQVTFQYRPVGQPSWTLIGTDNDGSGTAASSVGWIGEGDGWSVDWDPTGLPQGPYEVLATATDDFGGVMSGTLPVWVDPTPLAPRWDDAGSVLTVNKTRAEELLTADGDLTAEEVQELTLLLFPISWSYQRTLVPINQHELEVKDKDGHSLSEYVCGPCAAASCLHWFGSEFRELDRPVDSLAIALAGLAGTSVANGTDDDKLASGIKEMIKQLGLNPDDWEVRRETDPNKLFGSMVKELAKDKCDVIPLIYQRSNVDVNGDGTVDDKDVTGHYVTLSSRGGHSVDGVTSTGVHLMGWETHIDFMDPGTGEREEQILDDTHFPPRLPGYQTNPNSRDTAWVQSAIFVCPRRHPPAPKRPWSVTDWIPYEEQVLAQMPVSGPGHYRFSIPASSLPDGESLVGLFARDGSGAIAGEWRIARVGGYSHVDFSAGPTSGPAPLAVTFQNLTSPTDSITSWGWDFDGDRVVDASGANPTHLYAAPGVYTVELLANYPHGVDVGRRTNFITVTGSSSVDPGAPLASGISVEGGNPFRQSLALRLALAAPGEIALAVYDLAGRRVRILASGPHAAGVQHLSWDGRDSSNRIVPPGLYTIRMTTSAGRFSVRAIRVP